nr:MAG TPA: hypothetical protein [Caudoviricetes sp.]
MWVQVPSSAFFKKVNKFNTLAETLIYSRFQLFLLFLYIRRYSKIMYTFIVF